MTLTLMGTNITLGSETVADVLIGDPSENGKAYTLGIPKGDTHDWLDREVRFFGRRWRTVGVPDEGITANIPLRWGQNVHVRLLETSGSMTLYEADSLTRHVYADVLWLDLRGTKLITPATQPSGDVEVRLWSCIVTDGYIPKAGDIIVEGEQNFEFDTTTQQAASAGMAAFRHAFPLHAVVKSVTADLNGNKYNYTITAG